MSTFVRDPSTNLTLCSEYFLAITHYKKWLIEDPSLPSLKEFIESIGVNKNDWQTKLTAYTMADKSQIISTVKIPNGNPSLTE